MNNLQVKNWEKFQHYKDRNPPWIKLHFEILASEDWVMLADASKLLMITCMMIASRNNGTIPNDPNYIKRVAYLDKLPNLTPLIECGFLINPLADAITLQADARPETETYSTETEVDTKEVSTKRARKKNSYPDEFESFWKIYPANAASKSEALKSYNRAISKGTAHEQIERGAGAYASYLDRSGIDTAHATTWLNQQRWTTDYAALGGRKTSGEPAKQSFRSEAERIAAGFLSQPGGQGAIDDGLGTGMRIAEAIR